MKRKLLTLTLGAALVLGSMGAAFAVENDEGTSTQTYGRGNGFGMFHSQNLTVEELLAQKIEMIDQMVRDGKMTKEDGAKYKELITERMGNCTTVGENRDKNERLGIGFGRMNGGGRGFGRGMGLGRGPVGN